MSGEVSNLPDPAHIILNEPRKEQVGEDLVYHQFVKMRMPDDTERTFKISVNVGKHDLTAEAVDKLFKNLQSKFLTGEEFSSDMLMIEGGRIAKLEIKQSDIESFVKLEKGWIALDKSPPTKPLRDFSNVSIDEAKMQQTANNIVDSANLREAMDKAKDKASLNQLQRKEFHVIEVNNDTFLAKLNRAGQVELHIVSTKLGSGSAGDVYLTINLMKNTYRALKIEKPDIEKLGLELVKHEYDVGKELIALNNNVQPRGLMQCPKTVVQMSKGIKAIWMKEYSHDLGRNVENFSSKLARVKNEDGRQKLIKDNFTNQLPIIHEFLDGSSFLAKNNYIHGDLKPQNILFDDTTKRPNISDLGDAVDMNKLFARLGNEQVIEEKHQFSLAFNENYCDSNDVNNAIELKNLGNKLITDYNRLVKKENKTDEERNELKVLAKEIRKIADDFIKKEQRRDTFAMGCVMFELLAGKSPFNSEDLSSEEVFEVIDAPLQELIFKMLGPVEERPSPQEAFQEYDAYMKKHHNDEYAKMTKGT